MGHLHCQYLLCLCLGDGCLPKLLRSDRSTGSALPRSPSRKLLSLISAISARAAGSPGFIECNSAGMVAAMSSRRDRAFCRTKSSACLSASTAPASPPLLIGARQRRCPGRHLYPASQDVALRRGRCLPRRSVLPRQIWPRSPPAWTAARRRGQDGQVEVGVAFGEHQAKGSAPDGDPESPPRR
jgi:hypothetical protein